MKFKLIFLAILLTCATLSHAQRRARKTVTYEELFDTPGEINKLFIMFQPLYADIFVANVNIGFGLEAHYHLKDKLDIKFAARKAYAERTDFSRYLAEKNANVNQNVSDPWNVLNYYEGSVTYHINDREEDTETKVVLYSKRYKKRQWAAKVPDHIRVPSKVRKYYGVRLGSFYYDATTDLGKALEEQGTILIDPEGNPIPEEAMVYGNIDAVTIFVGGSMNWIKNFAIKPDKGFGVLGSDLMFNTYFDIMYAPSVNVEDVNYEQVNYSSENVETTNFGFRAGMEGKFNRSWAWSYNAEIGMRPSLQKRTFYMLVKIAFPVFSTPLDHEKEAFGK